MTINERIQDPADAGRKEFVADIWEFCMYYLLTTNRGAGTYRTQVVGTRPILSYGPCRRVTKSTVAQLNSHLVAQSMRSAHLGSHAIRGISGRASVWSLSGGRGRVQQNGERLREGATCKRETSPRNPWHISFCLACLRRETEGLADEQICLCGGTMPRFVWCFRRWLRPRTAH